MSCWFDSREMSLELPQGNRISMLTTFLTIPVKTNHCHVYSKKELPNNSLWSPLGKQISSMEKMLHLA